jgi:20S proteasome subunit beta 6
MFPFYTFNLLVGLDKTGKGVVFGFDAIGSYDTLSYGVQGSGRDLAISIMDNQLTGSNQTGQTNVIDVDGRKEYTGDPVELAKDVLTSVAERDIATGDKVMVFDITPEGINLTETNLRDD